jgi:hypothetical protein
MWYRLRVSYSLLAHRIDAFLAQVVSQLLARPGLVDGAPHLQLPAQVRVAWENARLKRENPIYGK